MHKELRDALTATIRDLLYLHAFGEKTNETATERHQRAVTATARDVHQAMTEALNSSVSGRLAVREAQMRVEPIILKREAARG